MAVSAVVEIVLGDGAKVPEYMTEGSAGCDVHASRGVVLPRGIATKVHTGLYVKFADDYELQLRPRSGLASKGVEMPNSPGTIDSDYRGEIQVLLRYVGPAEHFTIQPGERICQAVLTPVVRAEFRVTEKLDRTSRGAGGFGSTGV